MLLVRYKLNRFWPPRVNQFDISALLFGGYASFTPLDKMVFYDYWKALLSDSLSMLYIALKLFKFYNGICCSLFNYSLRIIILGFSAEYVSIIALVAEAIFFT